MKKNYISPVVEICHFEVEDIITTSSGTTDPVVPSTPKTLQVTGVSTGTLDLNNVYLW